MVSVLERELTCSICTDILLDPVTFIKCQHTNCGACAKSWFRQNETCPVCRQQVVDTGINSTIRNLLEDFLLHHPEKKRSAAEIIDARNIYKPGDKVLGALTTGTNELFTNGVPTMPQRPLTLSTPDFSGWNFPQTQSPTSLTGDSGLEEATAHFNLLSGITNTQRMLSSLSAGTPLSNHYLPESRFLRSHSLSVPRTPRNLVDLLTRHSNGPIQVTCDSCRTSIQEDIHYECTSCEMFHVCLRCHRHGRSCAESGHILLPQKLVRETSTTIQHLQTGIFCAICNEWCDEDRRDRPQAAKSFFWHCEICNNGHWTYCQNCVRRGKCCSHPLTLWTNNRFPSGAHDALLFRGPKHATVAAYPRTMNRGKQWLQARQYMRWTSYSLDCDICRELIHIHDIVWWHCQVCNNAGWDVCNRCCIRNGGLCSAMGQHHMALMQFVAGEGSGALQIRDELPVERPDLVDATAEAKDAVALRGVWEGEDEGGGMQWGMSGGHLWFPDGAAIGDVLRIFEDGGVVWYWGTYAGVGGIFDGRAVEIL